MVKSHNRRRGLAERARCPSLGAVRQPLSEGQGTGLLGATSLCGQVPMGARGVKRRRIQKTSSEELGSAQVVAEQGQGQRFLGHSER